jgi:hypothetical protein
MEENGNSCHFRCIRNQPRWKERVAPLIVVTPHDQERRYPPDGIKSELRPARWSCVFVRRALRDRLLLLYHEPDVVS